MRRLRVLGLVVVVAAALLVGVASQNSEGSFIATSQNIVLFSNNLCNAGQLNFSTMSWVSVQGGGYGNWTLPCYFTSFNVWYAVVILDYGTGRYEDIWYTYENNL